MYRHMHVHYTHLHIYTYIYICIYLHTYIHTYCIVYYAYSHEVAETAGLISHAFGTDEEENRHVIIFKKVTIKYIIIIFYNIYYRNILHLKKNYKF